MAYNTKNILRDYSQNPIPQVFDNVKDDFSPLYGTDNSLLVNTLKTPWRDDFKGTSLNSDWQVVQTGSGHTVSVASSVLSISTGTTASTETIIRSTKSFSIPFRVWGILYLSQRIANQEFYLEIVDSSGTHYARWHFDGTTHTTQKIVTANEETINGPTSVTTNATSSYQVFEIESFVDEIYFHNRPVDSTSTRSYTYVRTRLIPDPNKEYYIQIKAKNLSTAPASSTTFYIDAICVQDITELTTEITGARGGTNASQALPVFISGGTTLSMYTYAYNTLATDTTTVLGANATYTGNGKDAGSPGLRNRLRVMILHTAGNTPGHLVIEQSTDNSTFRETHRIPIPSDSQYRIFNFPILLRYVRIRFINGATAQTAFFIASALVTIDSSMDKGKILNFLETTTALGASATYTGNTLNLGSNPYYSKVRFLVFADQAGTLYLDQSRDGSTWRTTNAQAVSANTSYTLEYNISAQYIRVRYVNGATAQGSFELQTCLVE